MPKRIGLFVAGLAAILLLTSPMFFDIYRIGAFNAVPHDDYADYVRLLAHSGGGVPEAPYIYRIGSVAVAVPLFDELPIYRFSNLRNVDLGYLKATEALSLVSYLSLVFSAIVIFAIARKRYGATAGASAILALVSVFLSGYTSTVGIDPLAILFIAMLVYWIDSPFVFAPLVVVSTAFNEKIPFLFAGLFLARLVVFAVQRKPFDWYVQLASAWFAAAAYFAVRLVFLREPGYANQTQPTTFLKSLVYSASVSFSREGMVTNLLPIVIIATLAALALFGRSHAPFEAADVSGVIVLLVIALFADLGLTVGRVVVYSYPLYLPAIAPLVDRVLLRWDGSAVTAGATPSECESGGLPSATAQR